MKRLAFVTVLTAVFLPVLPVLAQEEAVRVFKAGAATSNITPPLGMEIVGNFPPRPRAFLVHDELHARALALDDGQTKLVFVIVDSLHLQRDLWDEAKKKVEAATGIPAANLMFSSTHTHSSVAAIPHADSGLNYRTLIISRVVDAVSQAVNNLEPARIAWGTGKLPQHVFNRRWKLKEGHTNRNPFGGQDRAVMNPGVALRPILAEPAGPTNPEVYFLSVQATDGRQIALLANYWLHYVGGVPRGHVSADYFGEFCRIIESKLVSDGNHAPVVGILANGPCGDINSNDYSGKTPTKDFAHYEKIKLVAGNLAKEVLRVHETLQYQDWVPLRAALEDLRVDARFPTAEQVTWAETVLAKPEDAPKEHRLERSYAERTLSLHKSDTKSYSCPMQVFGIGDLGIAAIPFEVFTETGLEIIAKSPFKNTFIIELANGGFGYLPTPEQHDLGGYETWLGTCRVEREASVKITAKILDLFGQIK